MSPGRAYPIPRVEACFALGLPRDTRDRSGDLQATPPFIDFGRASAIYQRSTGPGTELHCWWVRSKIVLNITCGDFYAAETGVNLRIFGALAAGCFLLTDHCDEIGDLFDTGSRSIPLIPGGI